MALLIVATVWMGVYPQSMLNVSDAWVKNSLKGWQEGIVQTYSKPSDEQLADRGQLQ
jgi:NADH-quinone oxidoreductase subunit M